MKYNKIIRYCDNYNINKYTPNGKSITHNKLRNKINDHTNKKHEISQKNYTLLLNSILKR